MVALLRANTFTKVITPRVPGLTLTISYETFLDREDVIARLGKLKARALSRVGLTIKHMAQKSIIKRGLAKPKLKVQRENPGISMQQLVRRGGIPGGQRRRLLERIKEIQDRQGSPPGTPPYTWTGMMRRAIQFGYDFNTESVVIGTSIANMAWLASLHEFGGWQTMRAWAYVPPFASRMPFAVIQWHRAGRGPTNSRSRARWEPTNMREAWPYPKRPYMTTALRRAINTKRIPEEFRNRFRVGGL